MNKQTTTFLLLLVALFWGTCYIALKLCLTNFSPFFLVGIRFLFAFLILLIIFFKRVKNAFSKKILRGSFILAVFLAAAFSASTFGLKYTTATNAAFLTCISAVFTPAIAYFVFKRNITKKTIFPVLLVTVGLYLLCSGSGTFSLNIGDVICLLAAFLFALQIVFTEKYVRALDPIALTVFQFFFCSMIGLILGFIFESPPSFSALSFTDWLPLLYAVIFGSCFSYVIQNICQKHLDANYVAIVLSAEPLFGAIFSFFILGEILGFIGILGGALIMLSIVYASLQSSQPTALP